MSRFIVSNVTRNKLHALISYLNRRNCDGPFNLMDIDTESLGMCYTAISMFNDREEYLYRVGISEEYIYIGNGLFLSLTLNISDCNLVYEYVDENENRILLEKKDYNEDGCYDKVCIWDYQTDVANKVSWLADVKLLRQYFDIGCDSYECD